MRFQEALLLALDDAAVDIGCGGTDQAAYASELLEDLATRIRRNLGQPDNSITELGRSTPSRYADGSEVTDKDGSAWHYDARTDTWRVESASSQCWSYHAMLHRFGPVKG